MRILYVDCFSGISGDMMVGALADLGVTPSTFEWELSKIDLGDSHLHFERQTRRRIAGIKFDVHSGSTHVEGTRHSHDEGEAHHADQSPEKDEHPHKCAHRDHRHDYNESDKDDQSPAHTHSEETQSKGLPDIRDLIQKSDLSDFVKRHSLSIFQRIGEAEAKTHGIPIEQVHFHEIGALDSIVDIVLATVGIESLGIERVYFSSLYDGQGFFRCSHGEYPLPAPATLEILKGIPISQISVPFELITPTGAAIVAEFQHSVGFLPAMRPEKIGYGVGQRDLPSRPNVLRAVLGELEKEEAPEQITELQANIDDLSPEILGAAQERLFKAGALDVFLVPIQMKKNRPGTIVTVLCRPQEREAMQEILFAETSTFGIRYQEIDRVSLEREIVQVETSAGSVQIKVGRRHGRIVQASPEFESCDRAARESQQPLKRIYEIALQTFWSDSYSAER
ncbi:MAG TPA: nickel pincer cofactor biosynthesis protein LarC [Chthoniobacterales bacterium]